MLIIVEGPDCAGKTKLTERLAAILGGVGSHPIVDVWHRGPPTAHPLDEYELPLLDYRPGRGRHVICDRWHLGELVYPALLDRPTHQDRTVFAHIELFLRSRGAIIVSCIPDGDQLRACLERRGDRYVTPDQVDELRERFLVATVVDTELPTVQLDANTVERDVVWTIIQEAEHHEHEARELDGFTTYVGPRHPKLLLLGDVRATGTELNDLRPAFVPYPATSGHYLLATIPSSQYGSLGLANACDVDDPRELWEVLGRPTTVTLGRHAHGEAPWADRTVPHPQYVRRFHHQRRDEYLHDIMGTRNVSWK